ncbi:MAG: hypothetical protein AAF797_17465 [Planctomycetota bacterium]
MSRSVAVDQSAYLAALGAVVSVTSIFAGFLGTATAIVVSFFDREIFRRLAAHDLDRTLVQFMLRAVYGLTAASVISIALMIVDKESSIAVILLGLLGFACVFSVLAMHRVLVPLKRILDDVRRNDD